jgi:hypothetical protein
MFQRSHAGACRYSLVASQGDRKMSQVNSPRVPRRLHPSAREALIALVLLALLCTGVVAYSPGAHAASVGRQVRVCGLGLGLETGKVVGANQRGAQQTWTGPGDGFFTGSFTTYGWWWHGTLAVYETSSWNPGQFVYVGSWNIPRDFSDAIYRINC